MKRIGRLVAVGILIFVLIIGISSIASAAPNLKWHTDSVYYDQGNLIVTGYFYNDGTDIVNYVNCLYIQVYFRNINTDWWLKVRTSFTDLNVYLKPGEISNWRLHIRDVDYSYFDYWSVDSEIDYSCL